MKSIYLVGFRKHVSLACDFRLRNFSITKLCSDTSPGPLGWFMTDILIENIQPNKMAFFPFSARKTLGEEGVRETMDDDIFGEAFEVFEKASAGVRGKAHVNEAKSDSSDGSDESDCDLEMYDQSKIVIIWKFILQFNSYYNFDG